MLSRSLSLSHNAVVQSSALQFFSPSCTKWQNTNMPFSSVFCLFLNEKATDVLVRDYSEHTNILLAHTSCWQAFFLLVCHAWRSTQMKGQAHQHPSPPQNGRDTSLIQLYEQTTKTRRERKNSSRCINLKALEKVKPLSLFSKHSTAAMHSWLKCMQLNKGKCYCSGYILLYLEGYTECVQHQLQL